MYNFNDLVIIDNADLLEYNGKKVIFEAFSGRCSDMYFTPEKYAKVDMFSTAYTGTESVWEIKNRIDYISTQVDRFGGHIFERDKYDALMEYAYKYRPFYTMVYPDVILIWNISKIDRGRFELTYKYPKTTAEPSGKVPKYTTNLLKSECCLIIDRTKNSISNEYDS